MNDLIAEYIKDEQPKVKVLQEDVELTNIPNVGDIVSFKDGVEFEGRVRARKFHYHHQYLQIILSLERT